MADSPLISKEVREYMLKFRIEETVTRAVNEVLRNRPPEAYSYLGGFFAQLSQEAPMLKGITARLAITESGKELRVQAICLNKGLQYPGPLFIFSPNESDQSLFDSEEGHEQNQACELLNSLEFDPIDINDQKQIDSLFIRAGDYTNITVSGSMASAKAAAFFKQIPLYQHIGEISSRRNWELSELPKIMMPVLYGGKALGSKVKFSKFYVYQAHSMPPEQTYQLIRSYSEFVRKIIASGKGGEAAIKVQPSGGFLAPGDTIPDCLKILEEAGNQSGHRLGEDLLVAIDCNADEFYLAEQGKYEMEGFKAPPDALQISEWYAKLLNDKPYIGILEDPMASRATQDWEILREKLDAKIQFIGTRTFNNDPKLIRSSIEPPAPINFDEEEEVQAPGGPFRPQLVSIPANTVLSSLIDVKKILRKHELGFVLRESSHESSDSLLMDLAIGLEAQYLIIGPPLRNARIEKYNRLLELQI